MADIIHRIGIKASPKQVFKALSTIKGLANWWTQETEGEEQVGGKIEFTFRTPDGDIKGKMVMQVEQLDTDALVRWRCVDGPPEWIGTDLTFDLSEQDDQTITLFGHRKWPEAVEFMGHCSMKWAVFLLSLREYVETGKGRPSPGDLKIDNWN
jgi:uncharacterized protein YndB with AHSA1/START domain